jgi:Domain of unknown function (DUF4394)/Calx-beta domain
LPWGTKALAGCTAVAVAALAAMPATGAAVPAVGVDTAGTTLWFFDTATPGTMTAVPITGLEAGDAIDGIDRRPATGALYGLAVVNGGPTDTLRLYRIDPATGVATLVNPGALVVATGGTDYGVDFNPFADRLRVVNDDDENLRLNPNNGALAGDDVNLTDLGPDADSRPIEGIAHSSNVAPPFGAGSGGSTTVFGIAPVTDELVTLGGFGGSANSGVVLDEKPLGFNADSNINLDVADFAPTGFLTSGTSFGSVSLPSGAFTLIGTLAHPLDGFTVLPSTTVTLDPRAVTTSEAAGAATIAVTRSNTASSTSVRVTTEQTNLGVSETATAASGEDYQPLDTRVNFAAGQSQATVTTPIVADGTAEAAEAFTVFLADPGANTGLGVDTALGADRATVTISADPGPPVDTTGPFAVLIPGVKSLRRTTLTARGLTVRYVCGEACGAAVTLRLSTRRLGTATARLTQAGLGSARVRLTRAGKRVLVKALKRRRSVRTTLTAAFTDAAGNATTKRTRITVRR